MPCPQTVVGKTSTRLTALPTRASLNGGLITDPAGSLFSKMGATMRCGNPHLGDPPVRRSHFRARHGGAPSALFAPFFLSRLRGAQSGPMKMGVDRRTRQNPNPHRLFALIQSPAWARFEDGCNHARLRNPILATACRRLTISRARHGGDASALFAPFFSPPARWLNPAREEMGSTGRTGKTQQTFGRATNVVFEKRIMLVQNLTGRAENRTFSMA